MDKRKFDAIFPIITAHFVDRILTENNLTEDEAIAQLYSSQLYSELENEETKLWQYSIEKLYDLYKNEKITEKLELPEY